MEHIPDHMHLVISTRSDPPLPIARLRSQNQMIELRSSELSFSEKDISVFFNKKLKLRLSKDDVYSLESKTEGWIAGLQLAALSMQGHDDVSKFIEDFAGDNRYIMDYLIEEVMNKQSEEEKDFLLHTSILDQISGPLCDTILNISNSQFILESLEKNNMFVFPLDKERHWYRYHHLFADLLKQKLLLKDKSYIEELHANACVWYEQNKMYELAIEHALLINNYEKSIQLLGVKVEGMWENGQHASIMKYGDLLPDEVIKRNPEFCLYYGWILTISGNIQKAELLLEYAESILKKRKVERDSLEYEKKLLGKISVALAQLNSIIARPEKILAYCKTAMEYLSEDDPLWYSWTWYSTGMANLALENYRESIEDLNKALEYGKKSGNIYLMSTIVSRLSFIMHRLGHYKTAYKLCTDF